jgi:hypothetical protein
MGFVVPSGLHRTYALMTCTLSPRSCRAVCPLSVVPGLVVTFSQFSSRRGLAQTCRHHYKSAAPDFVMFEVWAFLLLRAEDFFRRRSAIFQRSRMFIRHSQSFPDDVISQPCPGGCIVITARDTRTSSPPVGRVGGWPRLDGWPAVMECLGTAGCPALASFARAGTMLPIAWRARYPTTAHITCTLSLVPAIDDSPFLSFAQSRHRRRKHSRTRPEFPPLQRTQGQAPLPCYGRENKPGPPVSPGCAGCGAYIFYQ